MPRRTKIVATLGPASDTAERIEALLAAGVDCVRLNYSHGVPEDHERRAELARAAAGKLGKHVAVLCDLQGPKVRIESFTNGQVELEDGATFTLDTAWPSKEGNLDVVGCAYKELPEDVSPGDCLLLNDGLIALRVQSVKDTRVITRVEVGGVLSNRKGINKQGGGLSAPALTDKDREDLRHAVAIEADFIAVSFPKSAEDMNEARKLLKEAGGTALLVAKIERTEALLNIREIADASDVVMVARGDLGIEIGDAELPGWQKRIISISRDRNRMVITATQMMESMIQNPSPTRAEVLDVANAVIDGTDAVMLSAETASGKYPIKVVQAVARVCEGAERHPLPARRARMDTHFERTDEAIAMATTWTAEHMHADAIMALTESGATALMISRSGSRVPIFAMTQHVRTLRSMCLCRNVIPVAFHPEDLNHETPVEEAVHQLAAAGHIKKGDRILVTKGDFTGPGGTNTMKILTIDE